MAVLIALMIFIIPQLNAQEPIIDLRLFNTEARVFVVGDLDPVGIGNAPDYYTLRLANFGPDINDARISFRLVSETAAIVDGLTREFRLPQGTDITFTNNIIQTGNALVPGNDTPLDWDFFDVDFQAVQEQEDAVQKTGKLLPGRYEFLVELISAGLPNVPDQNMGDNILLITNPTTLEPIFPGSRVNLGEIPEIPTTTPLFIWQSDADRFNLFVYKQYESEAVDDVLSRDPILHLQNFPNKVFQYPSETEPLQFFDEMGNLAGVSVGAVRLIESGDIIYWQVESRVPTAGGETLLQSDVYHFKVSAAEGLEMTTDQILAYLRQILGENYDEVMQQLQGADPTGNIFQNGEIVDVQALLDLITAIISGEVTIQDVNVTEN
jgi:hypothetical protein